MYGEKYHIPLQIGDIPEDKSVAYHQTLNGSQIRIHLFDGGSKLFLRGQTMNWGEQNQLFDVIEMGERKCLEISKGARLPGQLTVGSFYTLRNADGLPLYANNASINELTAMIIISDHEREELKGMVLDVLQGCHFQNIGAQVQAQSQYMMNVTLRYRYRLNPLFWNENNPSDTAYPAKAGKPIAISAANANEAQAILSKSA